MTTKRTNKQYPKEFKEEAVALVLEQGYTVPEAAVSLGLNANLLYKWKDKIEEQKQGISLSGGEREVFWSSPTGHFPKGTFKFNRRLIQIS